MFPGKFEYHRPTSIAEAVKLLVANPDAKVLAGGHSLLPAMKLRLAQPATLIDIGRIPELKGISANGTLKIGALATHGEIAKSSAVQAYCAALAYAASIVGDQQVRNWGTLGGNLAHADPASDPPTVVLAAEGTINVQGPNGKRSISAGDFFRDLFDTDLQPGEIITSIEIPNHGSKKSAYAKMEHPASRYAVLGVSVVLGVDGGRCSSARVAVGGATPKATRSPGAEAALTGSSLDDAALNAAAAALQADLGDSVMGDLYAPADYRKAMAGHYLKQAVRAAVG